VLEKDGEVSLTIRVRNEEELQRSRRKGI